MIGREGEDNNKGEMLFRFGGSRFCGNYGWIHRSSVCLICPELSPRPPLPCPPVPVPTNDTASLGVNVIGPGWGRGGGEGGQ